MRGNEVYKQTNHAISKFEDKPVTVLGKQALEQAKTPAKFAKNLVDEAADLLE